MARVWKLMTLFKIKIGMCYCKQDSAYETISRASTMYKMGDIQGASRLFQQDWAKYSNTEMFTSSYLNFLIETGQYDTIIEIQKHFSSEKQQKSLEKARECKRILESRDLERISGLLEISPHSFEANVAKIRLLLQKGEAREALTYLIRLEKMYKDSIDELRPLRVMVELSLKNLDKALLILKDLDTRSYEECNRMNQKLQSILKIEDNVNMKINAFLGVHKDALSYRLSRSDPLGIYAYMYKLAVQYIVETGSEYNMSVTSFASTLLKLEQSPDNIMYYIKSLVVDKSIDLAARELSLFENNLDSTRKNYLRSLIEQARQRMEEEQRRRKAEWEQRERQRREQQRIQNHRSTDKAGQDFLGYYKVLGVDKTVTEKDLKAAHRKKAREATKRASKKKNLTQEQKDEEVKVINKAFQILSDPEKKQMYDMGIDPEKGPEQGQAYQRYHSGGGFVDEDQINEIFQTFFGGGGGRGRQRAQFVFL